MLCSSVVWLDLVATMTNCVVIAVVCSGMWCMFFSPSSATCLGKGIWSSIPCSNAWEVGGGGSLALYALHSTLSLIHIRSVVVDNVAIK